MRLKNMALSGRKLCLVSYALKLCIISSNHPNMLLVSGFVANMPTNVYWFTSCDKTAPYITIVHSKNNKNTDDYDNSLIGDTKLYRKPKQKRRKPKNQKRKSAFWADINNIENELRFFWSSVNVNISATEPPPIPNEALLNHFERHDLRYAIAKKGKKNISEELGGAILIPGKWSDATRYEEVKCLLSSDNPAGKGLSKDLPPMPPHKKRKLIKGQVTKVKKRMHDIIMNSFLMDDQSENGLVDDAGGIISSDLPDILINNSMIKGEDGILDLAKLNEDTIRNLRYPAGERWAQQENRKPRGYWDHDVVIQELYDHLKYIKKNKGRPSIWMPRSSELSDDGRNDLRQAISRYGGADQICAMANLIPYKEWLYFESQLELFIELQAYLAKYKNNVSKKRGNNEGEKIVFPRLSDIRNNGHDRLHDLIMDFGGRKIIAIRLNMEYQAQTKVELFKGMSFGTFDLEFAIRLMLFIRKAMMGRDPYLNEENKQECEVSASACDSHIQMPTIQTLLEYGETQLADDVTKYGGHESIARRLHLQFDLEETKRDTDSLRNV